MGRIPSRSRVLLLAICWLLAETAALAQSPRRGGDRLAAPSNTDQREFDFEGDSVESDRLGPAHLPIAPAEFPWEETWRYLDALMGPSAQVKDLERLEAIIRSVDPDDPRMAGLLLRKAQLCWEEADRAFARTSGDDLSKRLELHDRWQAEAMRVLGDLVERHPGMPHLDTVLFLQGTLLSMREQDAEADPVLARILSEFPDSPHVPGVLLLQGDLEFRNHRYDRALDLYARIQDVQAPDLHWRARYQQAWCLYNLDVFDEALDQLLRVIEFARTARATGSDFARSLLPEALRDLALFYSETGSPDQALRFFESIVPDSAVEEAVLLAEGYAYQGEEEKAICVYKQVVQAIVDQPDHARVLSCQRSIVEASYRLGSKHRVAEEVQRLFQLLENNRADSPREALQAESAHIEEIVRVIATTYHKEVLITKEEFTLELTHLLYVEYLRLFPDAPASLQMRFNHALLLHLLKKYDEAAERFVQVRDLQPDGPLALEAAHGAVEAYYRMIEWSDLEALGDDSADVQPRELPEHVSRLVSACERYLAMATPDSPDVPEARLAAAVAWYRYNHFDRAVEGLRTFLAQAPDHVQGPDAARLLLSALNLKRDVQGLHAAADLIAGNPKLMRGDVSALITRIQEQRDFNQCLEIEASGRNGEAAECFLDYVKRFPDTPLKDKALLNAGHDFFKAREIEPGLLAIQRLVNEMPGSPLAAQALFNLADTYRLLAAYGESARLYEVFVQRHASHELAEEALRYATIFRTGLGDYEKAIGDLRTYLRLFPQAPLAPAGALEIATLRARQGRHALARRECEQWLAAHGMDPPDLALKAHLLIALAWRAGKDEARAQKWFAKTVDAYAGLPDSVRAKVGDGGRAAAAEALYHRGAARLEEARAVRMRLPLRALTESISRKIAILQQATDLLAEVASYGQPNWTLAALFSRGKGLQDLAEAIESSPIPPGLSPEERDYYRDGLAQRTAGLWARAKESFRRCVDVSREQQWYNEYTVQAADRLRLIDPDFHALSELIPVPGAFSLNEGRPTLKPLAEGQDAPKWSETGVDERIRVAAAATDAHAAALHDLGALLLFRGERTEAASAFARANEKDPRDADAVAWLGRIALLEGRPDDAATLFERALQLDPANAVANLWHAARALGEADFNATVKRIRRALMSDPDSMDAYGLLVAAYLKRGPDRREIARLAARNALALDPSDGPLQNLLGVVLLQSGEARQAVQMFLKATRDDPRLYDARLNLGAVSLANQDLATAAEHLVEAVRLRPGSREARLGLAVALRGQGKGAEARSLLESLAAEDPADPAPHFNLCVLHQEALDQPARALEECRKFLELAPGHARAEEARRRVQGIAATIEVLEEDLQAPR